MKFSGIKIAIARKRLSVLVEKVPQNSHGNGNIGVILSSEKEATLNLFQKLKENSPVKNTDWHFVICGKKKSENALFGYPVFTPFDLGWNGKLKNKEVTQFLERNYDVLISFTEAENKLARLLVSVARAELKVGREEQNKGRDLYNLVISTNVDAPSTFIAELKKYLKILNKTAV